jgi:hypothetical protein
MRKLKGSLSDVSFESGATVFEGRGLFGAIAVLHDAFSRLRVLTVGFADRARPDGSLGKPPD